MIRILLLGAGMNSAYHFAKVIREKYRDSFFIIGTDINPRHLIASGALLDLFYQVPPIVSPDYYDKIISICKLEKIDVILPIFDMDQKLFSPQNKDLHQLGIRSIGTSEPLLTYYRDKQSLFAAMLERELPIPEMFSPSEIFPGESYFIKPQDGYGSQSARIAKGKDIREMPDAGEYIIQGICEPPEITVECFCYRNRLSMIARERLSVKAGVSNKARIYFDRNLREITERFSAAFNVPLCFNLQFMKNREGQFVITDVNLRFAGGMGLSYAAGWDVVSAVAEVLLQHDDPSIFSMVPTIYNEKFVVKASVDVITKQTKNCVAFDLDGTLLDSRARHGILLHDLLLKRGIELDTSDLIEFKKGGGNNVEYMRTKAIDETIAAKVQEEWIRDIETDEYLKFDQLYPDTLRILEHFSKEYELVLISARKSEEKMMQQLNHFRIAPYFRAIHVVPPGRNADKLKQKCLLQENVCLMIGDTEVDFQAARLAKIDFEFKDNGFRTIDSLGNLTKTKPQKIRIFNVGNIV